MRIPLPFLGCSLIAALLAALVASSAPHASSASWGRFELAALRGGGSVVYVNDVIPPAGTSPWLGVGYLVDSAGARVPSTWTSPDGAQWTRSTLPPSGAPEQRDGAFFVARKGAVAVAVGARFDQTLRPAAWWSADGTTWAAITDPTDPLLAYQGTIGAVTASPDGFLAVGVEFFQTHGFATVFRSADGSNWSVDSRLPIQSDDAIQPYSIVATNSATIIVGDSALGADSDGRIWVRPAGGSWQLVAPDPIGLAGVGRQAVDSVISDGAGGYLAGGVIIQAGLEVPVLWSSLNGTTWKLLPVGILPYDSSGAAVQELQKTATGFVASGNSGSGPRVWRSTDGRQWSPVPAPTVATPGGESVRIAASGETTVLVRTSQTGSVLWSAMGSGAWIAAAGAAFPTGGVAASLVDVATDRGRLVAVGNDGSSRPLIMFSQDGRRWRRVALPDAAARLETVSSNRGVFVIGGWRKLKGVAHLALWTSKNGTTWTRLGGEPTSSVGAVIDIAPDGQRFLAAVLENSPRGLITTVWRGDQFRWVSVKRLGLGVPTGVCVGKTSATVVVLDSGGSRSRVLAWQRSASGVWQREADLVAASAEPTHCAEAPRGTFIAGSDSAFGDALVWARTPASGQWKPAVVGNTQPAMTIYDIVRDGTSFMATGTTGGRGQSDLAVWRSSDGVTWSLVGGGEPIFVEPGFQAGLGVVRAGPKLVVVGRTGAGNAGLWAGP